MAAPTFPRNLNRHGALTGLVNSADGSKAKGVAECWKRATLTATPLGARQTPAFSWKTSARPKESEANGHPKMCCARSTRDEELLQTSGAEVDVEAFAVDRDRLHVLEIDARGDHVVLTT